MTTLNGINIILPLTMTNPHIEERMARDEQTKEMYLPLPYTVVLERYKTNVVCAPGLLRIA